MLPAAKSADTISILAHLQEGITALREERHRLANEAMRAVALEHRLKRAEAENARLLAETEKAARREHERESQIAQLGNR